MKRFEATTSVEAEHASVVVAGECDLTVRDKLTGVLLDAVDSAEVVSVDLAAVTFMDSSGLHALMTAHQTAQNTGRRLYVSNAAGTVAALLDLTGLHAVLAPAVVDGDARDGHV